ncbi:hypothetical protein ACWKSR_10355, partial [Campylobacter fetus subsp. venerealis]
LLAGNDVLLYSQDVPKAKALIKNAISDRRISEKEVDRRVKKILRAKYWAGLNEYRPIDTHKLVERLNTPQTQTIIEDLYADAITVAVNKDNILPFQFLDLSKFASLSIGDEGKNFQKYLSKYAKFDHFSIDKAANETTH